MDEFQVVVTPVSSEHNFSSQHKLSDDDIHYSSNESVSYVSGSPLASPVSRSRK